MYSTYAIVATASEPKVTGSSPLGDISLWPRTYNFSQVNIRQTRADVNLGNQIDLALRRGLLLYCVAPWMPLSGNRTPTEMPTCMLSWLRCERRFRGYGVRCRSCGAKRAIGKAGMPMRLNEIFGCKRNSIKPRRRFASLRRIASAGSPRSSPPATARITWTILRIQNAAQEEKRGHNWIDQPRGEATTPTSGP